MLDSIRVALSNVLLGLTWDDLSQHPLALNQAVSWLQVSSIQVYPNKPTDLTIEGRVIFWSDRLDTAEDYIIQVANSLKAFLLGECLPGISRVQISQINVNYSGNVEDSDSDLETYTVALTFTLTGTLKD